MNLNAKATKVGIAAAIAGAAAMTAAGIAFASIGGPVSASTPLETGSTAVQLTGEDLASTAPSASATSDDRGAHAEAGDDHGGATPRDQRTEAGDDRDDATEAGDDHGTHAEPGDDHGTHSEPGDDHGRRGGGHGSDD